jgi:acyl-CoA thioester hydrolase
VEITVNYRVIYGDTDCGGVVYYANYLRLFEIGRTELIRKLGITYKEVEERYNIFLPVVESFIRYRASAFYDDLLSIKAKILELKPYKVKFGCEIWRGDELLAEGYTLHVPLKEGKVVRFPKEVYAILEKGLVKEGE